jgi:hypothetical protein
MKSGGWCRLDVLDVHGSRPKMNTKGAGSARMRDAATVLPIIGLFLLMPPVITLFAAHVSVAGVPLIVVYLFSVWLALIVGTAWIARRLALPASNSAGLADTGEALK